MQTFSYLSSKTFDLYPRITIEKLGTNTRLHNMATMLTITGASLLFIQTGQRCHSTD